MVERDPRRLEQMYADGVRRLQPVHYAHSKLGDNQTDPACYGGLSPLGKDVIREASRLGMLVDAAHASYEAARDISYITGRQVTLSHTMMKYDSADRNSREPTRSILADFRGLNQNVSP